MFDGKRCGCPENRSYRCGAELAISLFGPWGVVNYTLLLVLRKFGSKQFIPTTAGLSKSGFYYNQSDTPRKINQMVEKWKHVHRCMLGSPAFIITTKYAFWRRQRPGNNMPIPKEMIVPITIQLSDQLSEEEIARQKLEEDEHSLRQEIKRLREDAMNCKLENNLKDAKCRKIERERDTTNEDFVNLNKDYRKLEAELAVYKKGKALAGYQEKIIQLQVEVEQWTRQANEALQNAAYYQTLYSSSIEMVCAIVEEIGRQKANFLAEKIQIITIIEEEKTITNTYTKLTA